MHGTDNNEMERRQVQSTPLTREGEIIMTTEHADQIGAVEAEIVVDGEGLTNVEVIIVPEGSVRREIIIQVANKTGIATEEAILFIEDSDEPLELDVVINEDPNAGKVHHVHRARKIEVSVHYQGNIKIKSFPPSARIQVVLEWAVSSECFNIDHAIAPEMELALHGETKELPKQAHIGRYVQHPHNELNLDLIRGVVPNGCELL